MELSFQRNKTKMYLIMEGVDLQWILFGTFFQQKVFLPIEVGCYSECVILNYQLTYFGGRTRGSLCTLINEAIVARDESHSVF